MGSNKKSPKRRRRATTRSKKNRIIILVMEVILILCLVCVSYVVSLMDLIQGSEYQNVTFYARKSTESIDRQENTNAQNGQTQAQSDETQTQEAQETQAQESGEAVIAQETQEQTDAEVVDSNTNDNEETTYTTILLVGVDARSGEGLTTNTRSDTAIICVINNQTKAVRLASVYRDTYLRWANGSYGKFTDQLQKGTIEDVVNSVNYDLDLNIDHFVVVNWSIAANIVNLLGGVEVELTEDEVGMNNGSGSINGYIANITENTGIPGEPIYEAGLRNLDGVQAVAYCRIRYVGNDYERAHRQRKVIDATLEKAKNASLGTLINVAKETLANVATDMSKAEILFMIKDIGRYSIESQYGFPSREGIYSDAEWTGHIPYQDCIVIGNFSEEVEKLHAFLYDDNTYQAPGEVDEITSYIREMGEVD